MKTQRARTQPDIVALMAEAAELASAARRPFPPDGVHDLRVALRRTRTIAQTMRSQSRARVWREINRAARDLFAALDLARDRHVTLALAEALAAGTEGPDPVLARLREVLMDGVRRAERKARRVLQRFDAERWFALAAQAGSRLERAPLTPKTRAAVVVARWRAVHEAAARVTPASTPVVWHELRIAVKKLRYTMEAFLPSAYARAKRQLKAAQDLLGWIHDLDVLLEIIASIRPKLRAKILAPWRERIRAHRARLEARALAKLHDSAHGLASWKPATKAV